jgi:hypothetical protein
VRAGAKDRQATVRSALTDPAHRYGDLMDELTGRVLLPFRTIDGVWRPDRDLPEGLHIVRRADEWIRLVARSTLGQSLPVPAVNWQTEMCVVAAIGARPTGGYFVMIDVIQVMDGTITVLVWEIRPGSNCGTTQAVTHPFHAVAVSAHAGEAKLVKRIAYEDCDATEY